MLDGPCAASYLRRIVDLPDRTITQLRRGVLEFCVLASLRDGECYGFELVRRLSDADGMVTSEGTLYPLLGRLRRDRLVQTTWRESPSGPPRRYYTLTPEGEAVLAAFEREWARFRTSVDALLETGTEHAHDDAAPAGHRVPRPSAEGERASAARPPRRALRRDRGTPGGGH
jgi:PadR family transcriptional regulator, regulatory protein PadR